MNIIHPDNLSIELIDLNPFIFQMVKKDVLKGIEHIEHHADKRTGDLIDMFQNDLPRDLFFTELSDSKDAFEKEVLRLCYLYGRKNQNLINKLVNFTDIYDTNDIELYFERIWVNYQRPGEFIPLHVHSGVFSFVLWTQIPYDFDKEWATPNSQFYSTSKHAVGSFEFVYADITGEIKGYKLPADKKWEGKLCIFPANLNHQVYPFYGKDFRITVSGNIRAKKREN